MPWWTPRDPTPLFFYHNPTVMNWIMLIIAGLFEVGFATCLGKAREADTNTAAWLTGFFVCLAASMYLLFKASQSIPLGTSYAVWTGIGAVGTAIVGIIVFKEPATMWRIVFLCTLVGSIIGLKAVSSH
jgi:quaternary ammonium compound-resistance protein SugE